MEFTTGQIAGLLGGVLEGDANTKITALSKIEEGVPGSISFLANPAYTQYIYTTQASLVIVNNDFAPTAPISAALVRVPSAEKAFAKLLEMYNQVKLNKTGISKQSFISEKATVGENIYVGEFAVISDGARIGNNCLIGANALITENKVIPDNSLVMGAPGRVVRQLDEEAVRGLAESAALYVTRWRRYARECVSPDVGSP